MFLAGLGTRNSQAGRCCWWLRPGQSYLLNDERLLFNSKFPRGNPELAWILRAQCERNRAEGEANYSPVRLNYT